MKKSLFLLLIGLFIKMFSFGSSTLFIKRDAKVLGKNYDAANGNGMLLKNNRGIKKTAYNFDKQNMAEWTSKFGSVTFTQMGKEFPIGGVNEVGLAVEMLNLPNTQYESANQATLSEFEWVQYVLDNYRTAADVALDIGSLSINPLYSSVHFLIADRGGRSLVVEFINGKTNIYSTTIDEYVALTNSFYANSVNYYKERKNNDNSSNTSLKRYAQLMDKGAINSNKYVAAMFDVMKGSSQDNGTIKTQWTIIYDLNDRTISYRTAKEQTIKKIYMNQFSYRANSQIYYRDINANSQDWKVFNKDINLHYLKQSLKAVQLNVNTLNEHMMNPSLTQEDDIYSKFQKDLKLSFYVKKQEGYIFYKLLEGKDNFKDLKSLEDGVIAANQDTVTVTLYSVKKSDYAVTAFHDLNGNNLRDKKLFGLCKEPIAYSKTKPSLFSKITYNEAKFRLEETSSILIPIQ